MFDVLVVWVWRGVCVWGKVGEVGDGFAAQVRTYYGPPSTIRFLEVLEEESECTIVSFDS